MSQVNFRTESATYEKFKLICMIQKQPVHETISSMIKNYVEKNADLLDNPKIRQYLAPELPSFFGDHDDWRTYINKSNLNQITNVAIRTTFLRYLLQIYVLDRDPKNELYNILMEPNKFLQTNDGQFIRKTGIFRAIREMGKTKNLPLIKNL